MCRIKWGKLKYVNEKYKQDLIELINKDLSIHLVFHSINIYSALGMHQAPRLRVQEIYLD